MDFSSEHFQLSSASSLSGLHFGFTMSCYSNPEVMCKNMCSFTFLYEKWRHVQITAESFQLPQNSRCIQIYLMYLFNLVSLKAKLWHKKTNRWIKLWTWSYILSGVMSCQNLRAFCQKLSYGSLNKLHCNCVSVSHLGLGCIGNHRSVNRRSLPLAQNTDGTTLERALCIAFLFIFLFSFFFSPWTSDVNI